MTNNIEGIVGNPVMQVLSATGAPLVAGKIYTYVAGSSTLATTYQDSAGTTPNTNPIILDARGSAVIWGDPSKYYKFVVKDSNDALVYSADNMPVLGSISVQPTSGTLIFVDSIASLRLVVKPTGPTSVIVQNYYTGINGGGGLYNWFSGSAVADNSGSIINPTGNLSSGRWLLQTFGPYSIKQFGAKCDSDGLGGGTDDNAAITQAITAANADGTTCISIPPGAVIRLASALTIINNVTVYADGIGGGSPVSGARFVMDLAVADAAVILDGGASYGSPALINITVTRATGAIPNDTIGIKVTRCYNPILRGTMSDRHAIGYYFLASGLLSIMSSCEFLNTGVVTDAHIVNDGWPEWRFSQCRFGSRDVGVNCTTYVRFTGGSGGGGGPNTVYFENCQFNQGTNGVTNALEWVDLGVTQGGSIVTFCFTDCHFENWSRFIKTDSTVTRLSRLEFNGCRYLDNPGTAEFFDLDAATDIDFFKMIGGFVDCHTFTFAPGTQCNDIQIANVSFQAPVVLTGAGNTVMSIDGNFGLGLTIGGTFGRLKVTGILSGGTVVNNSTSVVSIALTGNGLVPWTPQLNFGGAHVGMTGTAVGEWQLQGNLVTATFNITLTAKGSSTGNATITGLPLTSNNTTGFCGVSPTFNLNLNAVGGCVLADVGANASFVNLYQQGVTSTGVIIETNFTDTSQLVGMVKYFI